MSTESRLGAIVLSTDCSCVALVKRSATNLWGFPHGVAGGKGPQEAAKEIVKTETGITLSNPFRQVTFEVNL